MCHSNLLTLGFLKMICGSEIAPGLEDVSFILLYLVLIRSSHVQKSLRRIKGFFYLDQPCEKEDQRDEVEIWAPAWEAVDGSIHDEHPALLRRGLIYREYTGACRRRGQTGTWRGWERGESTCKMFFCPRVVWLGTQAQKFRHKHSLGISEPCQVLPITMGFFLKACVYNSNPHLWSSVEFFGSMLWQHVIISMQYKKETGYSKCQTTQPRTCIHAVK